MRKGIDGLAMLVQGVLRQDTFSWHLFVFRGRTGANLIKIIQAARAWRLPVAAKRRARQHAVVELYATIEPDRRH
jgi:transposase